MRRALPFLLAPLALSACKQEAPRQEADVAPRSSAAAPAPGASPAAETAKAAKAVEVEVENKLFGFGYSYPAQAAAIPALKVWLERDLARQRGELEVHARAAKAEREEAGFEYHPYGHSSIWSVVTELPGWLSLSANRWEFAGGAHGNGWSEALLWDKAAGKRRSALDLFVSKAALSEALRGPFCAELNTQRAAKRGAPVIKGSGDPFDECIDPAEQTVLLGSADKARFTRIGIIADAYSAGPYVEGAYEVTLPVTPALLRAVKPQYRALFAAGR